MGVYDICTEVSPQCPVEATTYGYVPNLAGNIIFLVVFGICTLIQFGLGIRYRLRAFLAVTTIGSCLEALGYAGRIIMHKNVWNQAGFKLQIVCLILAPSFLAAGIYLTLKHLVIHFGPDQSRIPPRLYPWIFISCDAISIIAQAAGGGLASSGDLVTIKIGNDVIIAGIAFQVLTMFVCILLAIDFGVSLAKKHSGLVRAGGNGLLFYLAAFSVAFTTIFIRCIYRIPEMSGGWGSPMQRHEVDFLVLDGMMIAIATVLMSIAHPGIFFPEISSRYQNQLLKNAASSEEMEQTEEPKHVT